MVQRARTLRFKLTLWYVAIFGLLQLLLAGALLFIRRDGLRRSLDARVEASAEATIESVLALRPEWEETDLRDLLPLDSDFEFAAVRGSSDEILASWNVRDVARLPFTDWETVPGGPIGSVFTRLSPAESEVLVGARRPLRLVTVPFRNEGEEMYFQAAVADEFLERSLRLFRDLFLIGLPLGLVAAGISAWLIAGRAVAPVRRLSEAARAVSPDGSDLRLTVDVTDHEFRDLQLELNDALQRLEERYRAQEQFLSNVSHELKTPIAVLLAEAQALLGRDSSREDFSRWAHSVEDEARRLGRLVESLLALTRSDMARASERDAEVSVDDLVLDAVRHAQSLARERAVEVVPRLPDVDDGEERPRVHGDPNLLATMLENLLRNAVRFSERGQRVEVTAEAVDDSIRFRVRDRGAGIPEGFLERVFERNVRAPNQPKDARGAGLGLAIAKKVAELYGGGIEAVNHPDGGCSFVVSLPRRRAQHVDGAV